MKHPRQKTLLSAAELRQKLDALTGQASGKSLNRSESKDELIAQMTPVMVGTFVQYPFRNLLMSDEIDDVECVVEYQIRLLLNGGGTPSIEMIASDVQDRLCGPEPLYAKQLHNLLRAIAVAIKSLLLRYAKSPRPEPDYSRASISRDCFSLMDAQVYSAHTLTRLERFDRVVSEDPENAVAYLMYFFAGASPRSVSLILNKPEENVDDVLTTAGGLLFSVSAPTT